jgi:light-regulated signal transduction histidine kinase (bacteriophytochrome)
METIFMSAKQMGILIDDLLQLSKTGRSDLKKSTFNMDQLVDEVLLKAIPQCKDRSVDWNISRLTEVNADYNLLRQVWTNLIDNALKYTRKKEQTIIEVGYTGDKDEFIFHIRDNGVGFDMKYTDKLFGVFQRLHSADEFEGSGIGLANVRRIISRHGGKTWAEGEPERGAVFYFSLPK